jgi:hypothetical protein
MTTTTEEARAGHDQHGHHHGDCCHTVEIHVNNHKVVRLHLWPGRRANPDFSP